MTDSPLSHTCPAFQQFIDAEIEHGSRFYAVQVWIGNDAVIFKRGLWLTRDELLSQRRCWVIEVMPIISDGEHDTLSVEQHRIGMGAAEWIDAC